MNTRAESTKVGAEPEPNQWNLLEDTYLQGIPLDEGSRERLLEDRFEHYPEIQEEIQRMWLTMASNSPTLDALPSISRQLWQHLALPQEIGTFEIREKIGQGGMGTVYLAWQPDL